eukprot:Nitzschia sp. Nitz4//scaffold352_size16485//7399//8871//NITZ4_008857-RA/size16485-augustus-gene-0.0-mRNA-1//1//CDS//3329548900//6613//frame0
MKLSLDKSLFVLLFFWRKCCEAFVIPSSPWRMMARTHGMSDGWTLSAQAMAAEVAPQAPSRSSFGALALDLNELTQYLGGMGRAKLAWDCYALGVEPTDFYNLQSKMSPQDRENIQRMLPSPRRFQELGPTALSKLHDLYADHGGRVEGGVASLVHVRKAADETTKLLLELSDGLMIETVIIPVPRVRSTLCMSTQVGCRQGCRFCATGRMGRIRNLSADEILSQMFFAQRVAREEGLPTISNVVFMGMGESTDNAENVVRATQRLATRELFQLSAKKIVVSTVGPNPESFKLLANAPCTIAWSVHAVDDTLRKQLVPTTRYTMEELRDGLLEALLERPAALQSLMIEVVLIRDVNDSLEHAEQLAEFTRPILDAIPDIKLIINLIPYNDIGHPKFAKPEHATTVAFRNHLVAQGYLTRVRVTRGDDETAACGQLATKKRSASTSSTMPSSP